MSSPSSDIRRVCVFCGSKVGRNPQYAAAAEALAGELLRREISLVYGGGQVGMMGVLADAVLAGGGEVIGVIPGGLATKELLHPGATVMHVTQNMHQRKAKMAELADAFIGLPGGYGTFEELFEVITWAQLGIHRKPIGLLSEADYFRPIENLIDHAIAEEFIQPALRALFITETQPAKLLDALESHQMPPTRRWATAEES